LDRTADYKLPTGTGAPKKSYLCHMEESFFDNVYEVAKLIPKGRVTSYGAIAAYIGLKRSARMVGYAMNAAHLDKSIPAHRVVNRNGMLTGKHHFGSPDEMQKRLEKEGIKVKNDQIVNFSTYFWDPAVELKL
jgi:methylated-DNA-protein-cysteine methyltransferase related protein